MRERHSTPHRIDVLGTYLDKVSYASATKEIIHMAKQGQSGYVCAANVHMVMEGYDHSPFRDMVNRAALVVPDGMPLVWAMRCLGVRDQHRVYGPFLMQHVLTAAEKEGVSIGLYGGSPTVLKDLMSNIKKEYSTIRVSYSFSPPFRRLEPSEEQEIVADISKAAPQILFVGLGCPKQERWMATHTSSIKGVMMGVGAAFDFHAGKLPMAPAALQGAGLEWAFRLLVEPRRLFTRYARHNHRFVIYFLRQLANRKK
jgi:N-acetylglucosaminyldiphosphoundecaprenol N-acetyl-beta-D-mannosaminyltransferase